MFGLGSPLAAPSLTEPARVRSQEREKETKRARWPREGRSRDESWALSASAQQLKEALASQGM